jgi:hypothetical protein
MIELSVIRDLVTIFGVIAGFSYYVLTMRNAQKTRELALKAQKHSADTRQAQLFMQLYNQSVNDPAFLRDWMHFRTLEWKDFDEYKETLGQLGSEDFNALMKLGGFLEGVAVLVSEDLLSIRLVARLVKNVIIDYWEKIGPMHEEIKASQNIRGGFEIEHLYSRLMTYLEEHPELTA